MTGFGVSSRCGTDRAADSPTDNSAVATTYFIADRSTSSATDPATDGSIESRVRAGVSGYKHNRKNQKS
nr:hypothetical protein [Thiohalomonas denitrificans]